MANPARRARQHRRRRSWNFHPPQATRKVLFAVLSVATALGVVAAPAHAQDDPAEIEAEIDARWNELRPIVEDHNEVRDELKAKKDKAEELEDRIAPLALRVDAARAEVSDIAVYTYQGGTMSTVNALLSTGSPLAFADRLAILDQFARVQREEIGQVLEVLDEYETEQAELDTLLEELGAMEDDLEDRADEIQAEIDELEALRDEAYSEGGGDIETGSGACPDTYPGGAASVAIEFACNQLGLPYSFGASGPDAYDCSGLTSAAWAEAGVGLPHNAAGQRDAVAYIDRGDLQPGDLVFYYDDLSHVAIYAGGGMIVQASQPGTPLNMAPIDQQPVHSYGRP